MVHEIIIVQYSMKISIDGRVRQIKFSYSDFNSVWLMSIHFIKSQNGFC